MAAWNDGYTIDVPYTANAFREAMPTWLAATALLMGQKPPDLARPFCYADLGCGRGLTAIVVAATCPHAQVWGFDFNPAHIEWARDLAADAGLTNVRFEEAAFADLAAWPNPDLPPFDFMVAHGVMSWVSPENRGHLVNLIGQRLRPGGLAYLSYNVATGWGALPPLRMLMRLLTQGANTRTDNAASGVLDYIDRLKSADAQFFSANPMLEQRLAEIRQQDPRYIAHEYLNQDWHPLMFAEISEAMQAAKCTYIGSATLTENIDAVAVPNAMVDMVREATDPILRETLRDFASAKVFRRDVYRRGVFPLSAIEQGDLLNKLTFEWLGRPAEEPVRLPTPLGVVTGHPELYAPLMEMLQKGPHSISDMRHHNSLSRRPLGDFLQALALLASCGYAHPVLPGNVQKAAGPATRRLNTVLAKSRASGSDVGHFASPVTGSVVKVDLLEILIFWELASGSPADVDKLSERLLVTLGQLGQTVQNDGKVVHDAGHAKIVLHGAVTSFVESRMPAMTRLGIFDI